MSHSLLLTPDGHLRLVADAEAAPEVPADQATALAAAFAKSTADGLIALAANAFDRELPATLTFWRGYARRVFQAVCQLGEGVIAEWAKVAPPDDFELAMLVAEAPPMRGIEYLDIDRLQAIWRELSNAVAIRAASFSGGPASFLHSIDRVWHLLGRVTFHLAENKKDPERPFAFLATYTHQIGQKGQVQHLPLAEALRTYATGKDQLKLNALLEPVKRAAQASPIVGSLLDSRALFAPQAWTVPEAYQFLQGIPKMEEAGVVVRVPNWWRGQRSRPQVQVNLGGKPTSEIGLDKLLDFRIDVALDGQPLSRAERHQLLQGTENLVLLRGQWVEVDRTKLKEALDHWKAVEADNPDGIDFIKGMRMLAGANLSDSAADAEAVAEWSGVVAGEWLRTTLEQLRSPETIQAFQPGRELQATLRPYQVDGVRWLWFLTELGLGACLADDMGLGKTIQVIDLLLQRKKKAPRPSLLVVPASLIGNWKQELARFAPTLRPYVLHGSETDPADLSRRSAKPATAFRDVDLVVTTYGLTRRADWLAKVPWSMVILDEAQAIKNAGSAQTKSVKKLPAQGRIVLTGTPVENHLGDLWSLFDFCNPGLLGTAAEFKKYIKKLNSAQDIHAYGALRRLVRPYILRRLKTDPKIAPDLPEKTEMRAECGLAKRQAALYEQVVREVAERLSILSGIERRGVILALLMQLKQICNHPDQYLNGQLFNPADSGKFERLRLLCEPIAERQEKVLVFTQFQAMTGPLANYLETVFGRPGLVLHGGTPVKKRPELVKQFQAPDGPPFFVISLKAGGSGLNLTAASHVVHFDRWWNPAVENQATDRAFRIGQKRNVLVHKFVSRGTVEERIDAMIAAKQAVADQILNVEGEAALTEMSNDELLKFVGLDIGRATAEDE